MSKRPYTVIALFLLVSFVSLPFRMTVPASAMVQRVGMPRLDQITAIVQTDPDNAWQMFKGGELDFYPDVMRRDIIDEALTSGHNVWGMPGFHVCYIGINTRDYVPYDAGQPDAGRPLAPLNWTDFRQALAWAGLSMEEKEGNMSDIYGPGICVPAYTVVPEALGIWHNPNVKKPGCNFTKAWELMQASGFYVDGTILYQPDGVPVRDTIEVLSPGEAPMSVEFTQRFVVKWNDFFDTYLGVTNCNFVNNPVPFITLIVNAFLYRNFDLYWHCWDLDRFPDFIYDFFHSSQDMPWGYNSPGIKDPELDYYLETVKWGLVYEEKKDACWQAQVLLAEELVPYIYVCHKIDWTIARGFWPSGQGPGYQQELVNIVNVKGVGADNDWTWMLMHWNTSLTGGNVNYVLSTEPDNLHPGWADSPSEKWILDRIQDGLTAVTPDLVDLAWIACDWEVETFDWPPLNIYNGTKVTFRIRDNVYWHDGWPVTAEDIKFSWYFSRNFPRSYPATQHLLWVEIDDPNTITAYLNITSQFIIYEYAEMALMFPKHIYNQEWHQTRDTINHPVWGINWQEWMDDYTGPVPEEVAGWTLGDPPPTGLPGLKALVGCGPYYFYEWDPCVSTAVVKKNPNYWAYSPVCCCLDVPGRIDPDTDCPFDVAICNQGAKDETTGEIVPVAIDSFDVIVDGEFKTSVSVVLSIDPFTCETFAVPGSILNLPLGKHEVCIKVYETGDLVNPIVECCKTIYVTIREDVNLDFCVNIIDIVTAGIAFGSQPPPFPGNERWDERADIGDDFMVSILDLRGIAMKYHWGECEWPPFPPQGPARLVADTEGKTIVCCNYNLTVYIKVVNVTKLCAYEILLDYNATLLELVDWQLMPPPGWIEVYPVEGYIAITVLGFSPFTGNATIVKLNFTAKMKGNATLDPSRSLLAGGRPVVRIPFIPVAAEVNITMEGDVTNDGKVRIDDVREVAKRFGTDKGGPPNSQGYYYHPNCDLTNDCKIRIVDVRWTAKHFGEGP